MVISDVPVGAEFSITKNGPVFRLYQCLGTSKHQPGKHFYAVVAADGSHKTLGCPDDMQVFPRENKITIRL